MEDVNKPRRIFLSPSKLECGSQKISSREIRLHLKFSVDWNQPRSQATKFKFKSDVFAAVAVVDAKAPYQVIRHSWPNNGKSPFIACSQDNYHNS